MAPSRPDENLLIHFIFFRGTLLLVYNQKNSIHQKNLTKMNEFDLYHFVHLDHLRSDRNKLDI